MNRYISQTETAKLIRKTLTKNFPGTKFSVKQDYNSIYVRWTDGPASTVVNRVVKFFEGASFDSMYDLKSYRYTQWNGEEVQFGCDYVFCERTYTLPFVEEILKQYQQRWGRTTIEIGGTVENAYPIDSWEHRNDYRMIRDLMGATSWSDIEDAYEALNRRQQEDANAWKKQEAARKQQQAEADQKAQAERLRKAEEAARKQEARDRAYREREGMRQAQRTILSSPFSAKMFLGVSMNASEGEIKAAFIAKVKAASDGKGGYTTDMDFLVQVRDKALQ